MPLCHTPHLLSAKKDVLGCVQLCECVQAHVYGEGGENIIFVTLVVNKKICESSR